MLNILTWFMFGTLATRLSGMCMQCIILADLPPSPSPSSSPPSPTVLLASLLLPGDGDGGLPGLQVTSVTDH